MARPEAMVHEPAHALFNHLEATDSDFHLEYRKFLGLDGDGVGVLNDESMALLIADYRVFEEYGKLPRDQHAIAVKLEAQSILGLIQSTRSQVKSGILTTEEIVRRSAIPNSDESKLRQLVTETFAYRLSNLQLLRSPDFFMRNPEEDNIRNYN